MANFFTNLLMAAALAKLSEELADDLEQSEETVSEETRIQLNPSTETKIPVLYGQAFFGGNISDSVIDTDYRGITHVLTLAEMTGPLLDTTNPTYTFHDVYMDGNRVTFDTDGITVLKTTDPAGNEDETMAGLIKIYLFTETDTQLGPDGFTITPTTADALVPNWGAVTHPMTNLIFAVIDIDFNRSQNVTSIPEFTFNIENECRLPGDVFLDFMTNTSYGCGISQAEILVDDAITPGSLDYLQAYGIAGFTYTNAGGTPGQSGEIEINGLIDTATPVLDTLQAMARCVNSWVSYDIYTGLWSIVVNEAGTSVASMTDSNIIGNLTVGGTALTTLYNVADVKYQNTDLLDKTDFVKIETDPGDLYANEPNNTLQINLPYTNKQSVALRVGIQTLQQSRVDKLVQFRTDYSYYNLKAGQLIDITSTLHGWTNKIFRIVTIKDSDTRNGIQLEFVCQEYDAAVYTVDVTEFTVETDNGFLTPGAIGKPNIPVVDTTNQTSKAPHILIDATVPSGSVDAMEYWITYDTLVPNDVDRSYAKIGQEVGTNGAVLTENDVLTFRYDSANAGDFLIKVRGVNTITAGPYSDPTGSIAYAPENVADDIDVSFDWEDYLLLAGGQFLLGELVDYWFTPDGVVSDATSLAESLLDDSTFMGDLSNQLGLGGGPPVTAPAAPTSCLAVANTATSVTITWVDSDTLEDTFTIERSPDGIGSWSTVNIVGVNSTSVVDSSTVAETLYYYRVKATNVIGDSPYSNIASVTTPQEGVEPPQPSPDCPGDGNYTNPLTIVQFLPMSNVSEASEKGSMWVEYRSNVYNFYTNIQEGTGSAYLYKTDGTLVETVAAAAMNPQMIDYTFWVEIPFADRELETDYYVLMDQSVVKYCDEYSPAITQGVTWNFNTATYSKPTVTPPLPGNPTYDGTFVSVTPTGTVECTETLVIEFTDHVTVTAGAETVRLYKKTGDVLVHTFTNADMEIVNGCGTSIQINDVATHLEANTDYYVLVDADIGVLSDCTITPTPNTEAITSTTDWTFSTDIGPEVLSTYSILPTAAGGPQQRNPLHTDTETRTQADLYIQYDQDIVLSTVPGTEIEIRKTSDDSLVQSFDTSKTFAVDKVFELVELEGTDTLKINPTKDLEASTSYYILADTGVVTNASCGFDSPQITNKTELTWTTQDAPGFGTITITP
jgi:hypothetical protein